jgi:hypothetical protein
MLNLFQHPWSALSIGAAPFLFHAKTRRCRACREGAFSFNGATGRTLERKWVSSIQAFFFAPSRLRVKPTRTILTSKRGVMDAEPSSA